MPDPSQPARVAFLSSHLGRWLHRRPEWFAALATACRDVIPPRSLLVSVPGTTCHRFLPRCAVLFQHRVLAADARSTSTEIPGIPRSIPEQDRLATHLAEQLVILSARRGSRTAQLVDSVLAGSSQDTRTVCFAQGKGLVPPGLAERWNEQGAHRFVPSCLSTTPVGPRPAKPLSNIIDSTDVSDRTWLFHCTRDSTGPWPGQSPAEYFDDLILGRPASDHSPLATLVRILRQQRLLAVTRPIAGTPRSVSFAAITIDELTGLRVFRAHRGRWDFEPFGIALSPDWARSRGIQPVHYLAPAAMATVPLDQRSFVQPTRSNTRSPIDWTSEREWRHPGDLDLSSLPNGDGLVFVSNREQADEVAGWCPWPVTVVPTPG